jgi:integrase
VEKAEENHPHGTQLYDDEVSGLRVVVGKRGSSFKFVGRINDGSERYISVVLGRTTDLSLKAARTRSVELRLALKRGEDPRIKKKAVPTVGEAADRYLESRGKELRPRTQEWYREKVDRPLAHLKKVPMDRLEREQMRALHEKITKNSGPGEANGALRVLKMLYNDVARTHDLPPNPVSRGVRLHRNVPRDWAISPSDLPALWRDLDAMEDRIRRGCWLVMLLTGLRSHDSRSMRWKELDEDGVLSVPCPKGGEMKAFKLPLPKMVLQVLEEVRELTKPLESEYIFPSPSSKSGYLEHISRTDTFDYAPHMMRHTWRTLALEAGVDVGMTMVLMNHRPAGVTWGYVTRANLLGPMREAAEKVAAKIASYRGR